MRRVNCCLLPVNVVKDGAFDHVLVFALRVGAFLYQMRQPDRSPLEVACSKANAPLKISMKARLPSVPSA